MKTGLDPIEHAPPSAAPTRPWLAVAVLAAALALDAGGVAVVNAALPAIGESMHIGETTLQWAMTSYAVTFAGFLLLGGRAADVLGRRRVFMLGVALYTAASAIVAVAPDATVLICGRALQGAGAALSGPASLALLTQLFPEGPRRYRALAIYTSIGASSFSLGLVAGGVLTSVVNWRAVFVLTLVIGLAVLVVSAAVLPKGRRRDQALDLPGALAVTVSLLATVAGISRASEVGWTDPGAVACLVLAGLFLAGFVLWESRQADPLLPPAIFRVPTVAAAGVAAVVFYTALLGVLFFAPLYMQGMLGYTPLQSGLAIVPMGITVVVASNVAGRLMSRTGYRPLMVFGLLLIAGGMLLWARSPLGANYWIDLFPAVVVMSVGQGVAFAALTAGSLAGVPQHQHGVAGGLNVTAQQLGGSVGVAALVAVANSGARDGSSAQVLASYHTAYLVAAGVLVAGVVAIMVLLRRRPAIAASGLSQPRAEAFERTPAGRADDLVCRGGATATTSQELNA